MPGSPPPPQVIPTSDFWKIPSIRGDSLTDCWSMDKCHPMWGSKSRMEIPKSSMQEDTRELCIIKGFNTETTRGTKLGQNQSESVEVKPKDCYKPLRALFKTSGVGTSREDGQVLHMHIQRHCYCVNVPKGTLQGDRWERGGVDFPRAPHRGEVFPPPPPPPRRSGPFLT